METLKPLALNKIWPTRTLETLAKYSVPTLKPNTIAGRIIKYLSDGEPKRYIQIITNERLYRISNPREFLYYKDLTDLKRQLKRHNQSLWLDESGLHWLFDANDNEIERTGLVLHKVETDVEMQQVIDSESNERKSQLEPGFFQLLSTMVYNKQIHKLSWGVYFATKTQ